MLLLKDHKEGKINVFSRDFYVPRNLVEHHAPRTLKPGIFISYSKKKRWFSQELAEESSIVCFAICLILTDSGNF
jgi:hypothetical protein